MNIVIPLEVVALFSYTVFSVVWGYWIGEAQGKHGNGVIPFILGSWMMVLLFIYFYFVVVQ